MSHWIEHTAVLLIGVQQDAAKWAVAVERAKVFDKKGRLAKLGFSTNVQTLYSTPLVVLGAGNFGVVMHGKRVDDGREVALKLIKGDMIAERNAVHEVEILLYLQQVEGAHGCRADITCYNRHFRARVGDTLRKEIAAKAGKLDARSDYFFIETRFEPGKTMKTLMMNRIDGRKRSYKWNVELMFSLANAVQFLHDNGVYHRDLKPDNIIVNNSEANENPQGVLLDVGIACAETVCGGGLAGDMNYFPPEFAKAIANPKMRFDIAPTDRAKLDVYALAATFQEWMTRTFASIPGSYRFIPPVVDAQNPPVDTLFYRIARDDAIWRRIEKALRTVMSRTDNPNPIVEFATSFKALLFAPPPSTTPAAATPVKTAPPTVKPLPKPPVPVPRPAVMPK